MYCVGTTIMRLAIGTFLLRITIRPGHRLFIHILNVLNVTYSLFFLFILAFQCSPPAFFWDRYLHPDAGSCMKSSITTAVIWGQSGVVIFVDWSFGLLPIFIVRDLHMNKRKKILLGAVLSLGAM